MFVTITEESNSFWNKQCKIKINCNNIYFKNKEKKIEEFFKRNIHKTSKVSIKGINNIITVIIKEDLQTLYFLLMEKYSEIIKFLYNNMYADCYLSNHKLNHSDINLLEHYEMKYMFNHGNAFLYEEYNSVYFFIMFRYDIDENTKDYLIKKYSLYKPDNTIMLAQKIRL